MRGRSGVIEDCELLRQTLCDTAELQAGLSAAEEEMTFIAGVMRKHIQKNAAEAQNQDAYAAETDRIEGRYREAESRRDALMAEIQERQLKGRELGAFIADLKKQPLVLEEWNERLWITLLDTAAVMADGSIIFRFKGGREIKC